MTHTQPATPDHPPRAVFELRPNDRAATGSTSWGDPDSERHGMLLRQNAEWFCRLRWWVVGLLCAVGMASLFPQATARFGAIWSPGWPFASAIVLTLANMAYRVLLRRRAETPAHACAVTLIWTQILVDLAVLTVVVHYLGCRGTYAPFTYLFHIILACMFLPRLQSLIVVMVAAALYLGCLSTEMVGLLPAHSILTSAADTSVTLSGPHTVWHAGWLLAIWGVIWYLASRLATALRQRDGELFAAHRQLVASCDERSWHMLQTTHQLKSPFAAIDANAQLLLGGYCGPLGDQAKEIVTKISVRCRVLAQQIQDMIQLANLRSTAQQDPPECVVDLAELLRRAIARLEPTASARGVRIESDCASVHIRAAEDHVKMLVDNLLANAINYSFDEGLVQAKCRAENGAVRLTIRDHGIGIPADKIKCVFDDYFRTQEAAHHNRASTGLGLAIVRHVVQRMHVTLKVESAPGWGTRFAVWLPETKMSED